MLLSYFPVRIRVDVEIRLSCFSTSLKRPTSLREWWVTAHPISGGDSRERRRDLVGPSIPDAGTGQHGDGGKAAGDRKSYDWNWRLKHVCHHLSIYSSCSNMIAYDLCHLMSIYLSLSFYFPQRCRLVSPQSCPGKGTDPEELIVPLAAGGETLFRWGHLELFQAGIQGYLWFPPQKNNGKQQKTTKKGSWKSKGSQATIISKKLELSNFHKTFMSWCQLLTSSVFCFTVTTGGLPHPTVVQGTKSRWRKAKVQCSWKPSSARSCGPINATACASCPGRQKRPVLKKRRDERLRFWFWYFWWFEAFSFIFHPCHKIKVVPISFSLVRLQVALSQFGSGSLWPKLKHGIQHGMKLNQDPR